MAVFPPNRRVRLILGMGIILIVLISAVLWFINSRTSYYSHLRARELIQSLTTTGLSREDESALLNNVVDGLMELDEIACQELLMHLDSSVPAIRFRSVMNPTLGDACYCILRAHIFAVPDDYVYYGWGRVGSDGQFYYAPHQTNAESVLFDETSVRDWLSNRSKRSMKEIRIEALNWLIRQEEEIGFPNEFDRLNYVEPLQRQIALIQAR
ncbi:MAG: hypothetical protein KDB14_02575 [Planctomycetales bacterium]|nr:hypothetical protein [Planctomycetales bacterium]